MNVDQNMADIEFHINKLNNQLKLVFFFVCPGVIYV